MGKQRDTQYEGTLHGIIWYKSNGKYLLRIKGKTGKQAEVAKKQAAALGRASNLSARIRNAFAPIVPSPGNRNLMYRLNYALQQWLKSEPVEPADNIPFLERFSFHNLKDDRQSDLFMPVSRTEGGLQLHIPQFDSPNPIYPLPFNGTIQLHIVAVSCSLQDKADTLIHETVETIQYDGTPQPARNLLLPIQTGAGRLVVVGISVNGSVAGVVGAVSG